MGGGPVARASQPCTSEPHSTGRGQSALAGQPLSPLSLPAVAVTHTAPHQPTDDQRDTTRLNG